MKNTFTNRAAVNKYLFLAGKILAMMLLLGAVNYYALKSDIRVDLTRQKQHTLSEITKNILGRLKHDVRITAFYVGVAPVYIEDMFKEYGKFSRGRIKTEIVDPLSQLGYAAQFGNVISGDEKKVFVQMGEEKREIDFREKPLSEEMLTDALVRVTREKRKVYFLAGHGEYSVTDKGPEGYSLFKDYLESANCTVETLALKTKSEVPKDCDVLVVAGPKKQIPEQEAALIQDYLKEGGKALCLLESTPMGTAETPLTEADKLKNPPLNEILNAWAVQAGDDVVVDMENYAGQDVGCPVTKNYPAHKQIINNLDYTLFIRPRSLTFLKNYPSTIKVAPLVFTASMQHSWAENDRNLHIKFDVNEDKRGPIMLAAVIWEPKSGQKTADTKIIVFGNAGFLNNTFVNQYSNADIASNSISWLSELENTVSIQGHNIRVEHLNLTHKQTQIIIGILVLIPLFIALLGCFVFWKQAALAPQNE